VRVVAGELRGRRIQGPPDDRARPTSDRVREAVFNALTSRGAVAGARVLDLFAGTGALGIEALSRGAAHATFVEHDRTMVQVLRANLAALGLGERSTVVARSAHRALDELGAQQFDLALLDPPYAFDGWAELLGRLPAPMAVVESDRDTIVVPGWDVVRQKRHGGTLVAIVERAVPAPDDVRDAEHATGEPPTQSTARGEP
jgi:16S rRNA (guanine966-N2)-methyltransferase